MLHKTITIATSPSSLLSTSLYHTSPSPSSNGGGEGEEGESAGIITAIIAAIVVVVLVLFIITTVIVVMMAIFTWRRRKKSNLDNDQALPSYSAKEMEVHQNACYAASSKIEIE